MAFKLQAWAKESSFIPNRKVLLMKLVGIILIAVGILALAYQGFSYSQTQKDAQLGPIEIQHTETHTVPIPPLVGGGAVLVGAVLLAMGSRGNL